MLKLGKTKTSTKHTKTNCKSISVNRFIQNEMNQEFGDMKNV